MRRALTRIRLFSDCITDAETDDDSDAREDLDSDTLLAIRRSFADSSGTQRQRKRPLRENPVDLGNGDDKDFSAMSESDLRYHKYQELKEKCQEYRPNRVIPNGMSYTLHDQARNWADEIVLSKAHKSH